MDEEVKTYSKIIKDKRILIPFCAFSLIIVAFLLIGLGAVLGIADIRDLQPWYIVNEAIDVFGLIIALIIIFSQNKDVRLGKQMTTTQFTFQIMLLTISLGLFSDSIAWVVQGVPEFRVINYIDNCIYYICGVGYGYSFWLYVRSVCSLEENKHNKILSSVQLSIFILSIILIICNVFFGYYYTVDVNGIYQRSEYGVYLNAIPSAIIMIIALVSVVRSKESNRIKGVVAAYGATPYLGSIVQLFIFGISVLFPLTLCTGLVVYSNVQVDRTIELFKTKKREIDLQRITNLDELTNLNNRRKYDATIDQCANISNVGVIFSDINGLKKTNDTFGHKAGDELIIKYANILNELFDNRHTFRISGDEFVVIIPNVVESEFYVIFSSLYDMCMNNDEIASVGQCFGNGKDILELISKAENEMYESKRDYHSRHN